MVGIKQCVACAVAAGCGLAAPAYAGGTIIKVAVSDVAEHASSLPAGEPDAVQRQLIHSAASLNALALACGRLSQNTADTVRGELRDAIVSQGVAQHAYEAAYGQAQQQFALKWQHANAAQQRTSCERMHWQSAHQQSQPH